jgi:hypothetical protein
VPVEIGAVQARVAGDAGSGPALDGQADRLGPAGPAPDLEGDHGASLNGSPGPTIWPGPPGPEPGPGGRAGPAGPAPGGGPR